MREKRAKLQTVLLLKAQAGQICCPVKDRPISPRYSITLRKPDLSLIIHKPPATGDREGADEGPSLEIRRAQARFKAVAKELNVF